MFQTDQPSFSQTNSHNQHSLSTARTTEFQPVYTAPAQTRTGEALPSRKKQNKTLPSTNPEAAENEFLKRELNMAKTEIVKLETKNRDLQRSISLYAARLKLFEEREDVLASERLLGSSPPVQSIPSAPSAPSASSASTVTSGPSKCSPSSQVLYSTYNYQPVCPCIVSSHHYQPIPCNNQAIQDQLAAISQDLVRLKAHIPSLVKTQTIQTQTATSQPHSAGSVPPSSTPSSAPPLPTPPNPTQNPDLDHISLSQSVSSIEEFIPTIEEEAESLNSMDLTNQPF